MVHSAGMINMFSSRRYQTCYHLFDIFIFETYFYHLHCLVLYCGLYGSTSPMIMVSHLVGSGEF